MPFKQVGPNDYVSPSGKHFNDAQVKLYYANGGKFPSKPKGDKKIKKSKPNMPLSLAGIKA